MRQRVWMSHARVPRSERSIRPWRSVRTGRRRIAVLRPVFSLRGKNRLLRSARGLPTGRLRLSVRRRRVAALAQRALLLVSHAARRRGDLLDGLHRPSEERCTPRLLRGCSGRAARGTRPVRQRRPKAPARGHPGVHGLREARDRGLLSRRRLQPGTCGQEATDMRWPLMPLLAR